MPERYDPQPDNYQETPGDEPVYGPSVVIAALDQIEIITEEARTVPLSPNVIVNKAGILDLVAQAREALPEDLVAADAVVADADSVLERADSAAEATIAEANGKARAMLDETRDKVDTMLREASEESDRRVKRAQDEANEIRKRTEIDTDNLLKDAREKAARMVAAETVLVEAQDQARELLKKARSDAEDMKLGADDYASTQLSQVSQMLEDLLRRTEAGRRTIAERTGFNNSNVDIK